MGGRERHRIATGREIQNVPVAFLLQGNGFSEKTLDPRTSNPSQLIQTHFAVPIRRWVFRV